MNIWLVQTGEILPLRSGTKKLRTGYLTDELIQRGHSVIWWASAFDHLKKKWLYSEDTETVLNDKLTIKAIKGTGYRKNISLSRFIDHRIIARKFKNAVSSLDRPDIIVASLPAHDLAFEASVYAEKNKIPILVDIRDPWPDIFLENVPPFMRNFIRLLLNRDFKMAERTMKSATGIISVMNVLLEWGLNYADRERTLKDRIFFVGYKRDITSEKQTQKIDKILQELKDKFVVTFIGTFAEYHNPSILAECAAILQNDRRIHFILAGDGQLMEKIRRESSSLPNITLTGWVEKDEINALLKGSNVGVCPANQVACFFPSKAFAYFSAGLPVISAFQGDLKEILENCEAGFQYDPNDASQLVNYIIKMADDPELYKKISGNAMNLFNEIFDADKIYKEYADHIEGIARNELN